MEDLNQGLGTEALVGLGVGIVVLVLVIIALAYLVWHFLCNKQEKEREPEVYTVLINGEAKLHAHITLPTDEVKLKATCRPETQPLGYTYSWANTRDPDNILERNEEYTATNLGQGDHEYTATVNCGKLQKDSTAKVTVISETKVEHHGSRIKGIKAERGRPIWRNHKAVITELPKCLDQAVLFSLPYDLKRNDSDLIITIRKPSTIYIATISSESDGETKTRSRKGWSTAFLENIGFTYLGNEKVITDYWIGRSYCSLSLYKKDGTTGINLPRAGTEESLVALFVKK